MESISEFPNGDSGSTISLGLGESLAKTVTRDEVLTVRKGGVHLYVSITDSPNYLVDRDRQLQSAFSVRIDDLRNEAGLYDSQPRQLLVDLDELQSNHDKAVPVGAAASLKRLVGRSKGAEVALTFAFAGLTL